MPMISAFYRYDKKERRAVARLWAQRSNAVQAAARRARVPDADTLRRRALHDARGQTVREGTTYTAAAEIAWRVARSRHGRSNQLDVIVNGRIWRTAGARRIAQILRRAPLPKRAP